MEHINFVLWEVFVVKETWMRRMPALLAGLVLTLSLALPAYAAGAGSAESMDELTVMPIAENQSYATYQNVRMQGRLNATDPEGGELRYEILEMPKKGTVTLNEAEGDVFVYTPNTGKTGKDSFTFCVEDENGNVSAPATVKVEILKSKTGIRYADMEDNAAHAASVRLAEEGVFTGRQVGKEFFFDPDAQVSRSEFLAMAMSAAGIDEVPAVSVTGFSDDENIPSWAKAYASEALNAGVISGQVENGRVVFSADTPITYSEAAAILNRTMAVTDVDAEAFSGENVPAWAVQSVANLSSVGVLSDGTDCNATLTRAAAAEMLCAAMDLMESKSSGPFDWLK